MRRTKEIPDYRDGFLLAPFCFLLSVGKHTDRDEFQSLFCKEENLSHSQLISSGDGARSNLLLTQHRVCNASYAVRSRILCWPGDQHRAKTYKIYTHCVPIKKEILLDLYLSSPLLCCAVHLNLRMPIPGWNDRNWMTGQALVTTHLPRCLTWANR